jgi:hypothetical protein
MLQLLQNIMTVKQAVEDIPRSFDFIVAGGMWLSPISHLT